MNFKAQPDFDALAPTTTKGDLIAHTSTGNSRQAIGTDGQLLTADSTQTTGMKWASPGALIVNALTGATTIPVTNDFLLLSGTTFAVTMFSPTGNSGKVVRFLKTDGFTTSISITGTGLAGVTMQTFGEQYGFICDGATFWPFEHKTETTSFSFVPTGSWSTNTTYTGFWQRRGEKAVITWGLSLAGAPTSATLTLNLPSGLAIDTSKLTNSAGSLHLDGNGLGLHSGAGSNLIPFYASTTSISVGYINNGSTSNVTTVNQAAPVVWASGDKIEMTIEVPIVGWGA